MDTKVLEYLVVIAQEGNMARAAERLFLSESALSRSLKKVELEFGETLFYRKSGNWCLTDAGKIYMNAAQEILYTEQQMIKELNQFRKERNKTLSVLIEPNMEKIFLRKVLPEFSLRMPGCELKLKKSEETETLIDALKNGIFDIAVMQEEAPSEAALHYSEIYEDELVMVVSEATGNSMKPEAPAVAEPKDFANYRFFLQKKVGFYRSAEHEIFCRCHFFPNKIYECSNPPSALQMVLERGGVSFIPRSIAEEYTHRLQIYSLTPRYMYYTYVVHLKDLYITEPVKILLEIIKKEFEEANKRLGDRYTLF